MDWILFLGKKFVSALLYPLGLCLFLGAVGIFLWRRRPAGRSGCALVSAAWILLLLSSQPLTGVTLLRGLEQEAGKPANSQGLVARGVRFVVVLGGGVRQGDLPPLNRPDCDAMARLLEGIRLWRALPGSKLVVSGGAYSRGETTCADAVAEAAIALGVPADAIIRETRPLDTDDEAALLQPLLGKTPFVLVTSAVHMRRSVATFKRHGLAPIAAPTDFRAVSSSLSALSFFPSSRALDMTQAAVHEYLGLWWLRLKGVFSSARQP